MALDLREAACEDVVERVQHCLDTRFDRATAVAKRRSLGFRTERGTWVRIEARPFERFDGQAWGFEAASALSGVARPAWWQGVSWVDHERGVRWRADEIEHVAERPIKPGGILTAAPELAESWWTTLNASLTALARHTTTRIATPGLRPITQARITESIHRHFPGVDATVTEWTPAHGDLAWANLTAPACRLLDWEDWGLAPRGWDAATLWSQSGAIPALAERVARERRADLGSRSGRLAQLFCCAQLLAAPAGYAGPLLEPATTAATALVALLRS